MSAPLTFDAGMLARGWLATSLAAGKDEELPILFNTLLIEAFEDGVRLSATDRYMVLSTWISSVERDADDERPLDEAPLSATVVRDPDGRGRALLSYLRKVAAKAAKDELPAPHVALLLDEPVEDGAEPGFPGMELRQVVIDYPDHEKLALPIVQGEFPAYRTILLDHKAESTQNIALGADLVARLGQVAKIIGGFLRCTLGGPESMVGVEISGDLLAPIVRGGVMPVRTAEADVEAAA